MTKPPRCPETLFFQSSFRFKAELCSKYNVPYSPCPFPHSIPFHQHQPSVVTADESTLTHHHHYPKLTVYITVSQRVISLSYKPSVLHLFILHTPSPTPATTCLLTVSSVLPFTRSHIVGIIQSVTFSDWLLSLSNIHLNVLHISSWLDSFLLFSAEQYSIVQTCSCLLSHSPSKGHVGYTQVLTMMNKAVISIHASAHKLSTP